MRIDEKPTAAVTGAAGYVGSIIVAALADVGRVIRLIRRPLGEADAAWSFTMSTDEMARVLLDNHVDCVFHAAWDMKANSLEEIRGECVEGSERLLAAARDAGVQNFVFISTISAFGGAVSAYGRSKLLVENKNADYGGLTLRLGLVYGGKEAGLFGNLRKMVERSRLVPLIGDGMSPQYLLTEDCLGIVVRRALAGDFAGEKRPITIANPTPIPLRELLVALAGPARSIAFLPIPWRALYFILRTAEALGVRFDFRSDSILSFIYQDQAPDFAAMRDYRIEVAPFDRLYYAKKSAIGSRE
jgi:nucleoside-diphosphate-sugar epimerase